MSFFSGSLKDREKRLEESKVDEELASSRARIAERKVMESEMKKREGSGWRKVWGMVKSIKPDEEKVSDYYAGGFGDLRDLSDPRGGFRRRR